MIADEYKQYSAFKLGIKVEKHAQTTMQYY